MLENLEQYLDLQIVQEHLVTYGMNILGALAIFVIGRVIAKIVLSIISKLMRRAKVDETLVSFGGNLAYGLLLTFVVIASLEQLGVETTSLAAIFAAAGLAIGLALQGSLSNFASGVMIIAFRPFRLGDYIEAAGTGGIVSEISIFTTTLKTPDNKVTIVPNSSITTGNITNFSAEDNRRIDLVFGIGYEDSILEAKKVIEQILADDSRVLKDPAPYVGVVELADSSVNIGVRPWCHKAEFWGLRTDLLEAVKHKFDEKGISIPYPQTDIHIQGQVASLDKAA